MTEPATLLVGDIGGTNARFAIARLDAGGVQLGVLWKRPASGFASFGQALQAFRTEVPARLNGAALGVAGPVAAERVDLTNSDWVIDVRETADELGVASVMLANDFEAMARSAPDLSAAVLEVISRGERDRLGSLAIVGPGTGLGVGALRRIQGGDGGWVVVGGEGGHQAFAPQTELDWRVAELVRAELGYVSNEIIASGVGLAPTLSALATVLGRTVPSWTAEDVHQAALKGDPLADAFYALRARTVMSALGDQTLAVKATGGAFVAGGIGARLADWLRRPDALARFHVGGPQSELMARIPVSLIRDETAPLIGAALLWRDWRARGWR